MNFLLPFFMCSAVLLGVPVVLHILRRKPQVPIVFPTLRFLGPTAVRETRQHRLRRWLTLLLRCLVILLVGAAFSRPFWTADRQGHGRATIVAVDNSFSMQTTGRWNTLRAWALKNLQSLGPGDQAGILLMNPTPHWLVPLSGDLDLSRSTLAKLAPGYETTRYDAALRLATDTLAHSGAQQINLVWMGDEQQLGWRGVDFATALPEGLNLKLPPVSPVPGRQAGISQARWGSSGSSPALQVDINQYLPERDTRVLTISAGGKILARQQITLEAGATNHLLIPLSGQVVDLNQGVKIQLDPDDLPVDDTFYLLPASQEKTRVLLTPLADSRDFDFLRHAINSTRQVTAAPLSSADLPEGDWPLKTVVLVRGAQPFTAPLSDRLNRFLQQGGMAWILLDGDPAQTAWMKAHRLDLKPESPAAEDSSLHLSNWETEHPILAPLAEGGLMGLLDISFYQGWAIEGADATPLASWPDGSSALAEVSSGSEHFLVSGFDFNRETTDWPVKVSFVPFVHSAALWLAQQQPGTTDWRVGDTITLPGTGSWVAVDTPRPQADLETADSVRPEMPGLYRFTSPAQPAAPSQLYAVNVKPDESDLTPWPNPGDFLTLSRPAAPSAEPRSATILLSGEEAENQQRLWWWLLALALIFIVAELRLANRTSL